jgi:hypothetical protein
VIWGGVLFSTLIPIRSVNHLFAWRLAPHSELVLNALFCAQVVQAACAPADALRRLTVPAAMAMVAGAGVLSMATGLHHQRPLAFTVLAALTLAAAAIGGAFLAQHESLKLARKLGEGWPRLAPWLLAGLAAAALYATARRPVSRITRSSNLLNHGHRSLTKMCVWVAENTSKDAVFLTPPDDASFRFWCRRAVVVDWKCNPVVGSEVEEYIERLKDVTGKNAIVSAHDLRGYMSLNAKRVQQLRDKYRLQYVVVRSNQLPRVQSVGEVVYRGSGMIIIDLGL